MKRVALIFALAVIAPSLVLAWLAVRSLRDQEMVIERQQTLLYQGVADAVARNVVLKINEVQTAFNQQIETLLRDKSPREVAPEFDTALRRICPLAEVGFAVSLPGQILAPSPFTGPEARRFRVENDRFLCSAESVEVYWNGPKGTINLTRMDQKEAMDQATKDGVKTSKAVRTVVPEKDNSPAPSSSKTAPEEAAFRQIVGNAESGMLGRFLQDRLNLLFWYRPPAETQFVFGAQINLAKLTESLRSAVSLNGSFSNEICVVLLDDSGRPAALSHPEWEAVLTKDGPRSPQFIGVTSRRPRNAAPIIDGGLAPPVLKNRPPIRPDWKHPFVATEIGDMLPHWEVGVYLLDPTALKASARTARLTLGLLIGVLVLAIAAGSWLIVGDLRRQLMLARQKTDFVSNVSHELKTPLTSIRMFSEMLAEGRVPDESKHRQFLGIITAETARLTRLINNVLDFARLERGEKKYEFSDCDLAALALETAESYRPHLESSGFRFTARLPAEPVPVRADRDALAQVMVNLLSNAEKYSNAVKEIELEVSRHGDSAEFAVRDRGMGVPGGCGEKIFDQFYRAHDSLASGIQGSGLGLTLARQIARSHGGDVTYEPRDGSGSSFTLRLPIIDSNVAADVRRL